MADSNPWKAQMLNKNKNNTEQNKSHETTTTSNQPPWLKGNNPNTAPSVPWAKKQQTSGTTNTHTNPPPWAKPSNNSAIVTPPWSKSTTSPQKTNPNLNPTSGQAKSNVPSTENVNSTTPSSNNPPWMKNNNNSGQGTGQTSSTPPWSKPNIATNSGEITSTPPWANKTGVSNNAVSTPKSNNGLTGTTVDNSPPWAKKTPTPTTQTTSPPWANKTGTTVTQSNSPPPWVSKPGTPTSNTVGFKSNLPNTASTQNSAPPWVNKVGSPSPKSSVNDTNTSNTGNQPAWIKNIGSSTPQGNDWKLKQAAEIQKQKKDLQSKILQQEEEEKERKKLQRERREREKQQADIMRQLESMTKEEDLSKLREQFDKDEEERKIRQEEERLNLQKRQFQRKQQEQRLRREQEHRLRTEQQQRLRREQQQRLRKQQEQRLRREQQQKFRMEQQQRLRREQQQKLRIQKEESDRQQQKIQQQKKRQQQIKRHKYIDQAKQTASKNNYKSSKKNKKELQNQRLPYSSQLQSPIDRDFKLQQNLFHKYHRLINRQASETDYKTKIQIQKAILQTQLQFRRQTIAELTNLMEKKKVTSRRRKIVFSNSMQIQYALCEGRKGQSKIEFNNEEVEQLRNRFLQYELLTRCILSLLKKKMTIHLRMPLLNMAQYKGVTFLIEYICQELVNMIEIDIDLFQQISNQILILQKELDLTHDSKFQHLKPITRSQLMIKKINIDQEDYYILYIKPQTKELKTKNNGDSPSHKNSSKNIKPNNLSNQIVYLNDINYMQSIIQQNSLLPHYVPSLVINKSSLQYYDKIALPSQKQVLKQILLANAISTVYSSCQGQVEQQSFFRLVLQGSKQMWDMINLTGYTDRSVPTPAVLAYMQKSISIKFNFTSSMYTKTENPLVRQVIPTVYILRHQLQLLEFMKNIQKYIYEDKEQLAEQSLNLNRVIWDQVDRQNSSFNFLKLKYEVSYLLYRKKEDEAIHLLDMEKEKLPVLAIQHIPMALLYLTIYISIDAEVPLLKKLSELLEILDFYFQQETITHAYVYIIVGTYFSKKINDQAVQRQTKVKTFYEHALNIILKLYGERAQQLAEVYLNRANAFLNLGLYDLFHKDIQQALKIFKGYSKSGLRIAQCNQMLGRVKCLQDKVSEGIELMESSSSLFIKMANYMQALKINFEILPFLNQNQSELQTKLEEIADICFTYKSVWAFRKLIQIVLDRELNCYTSVNVNHLTQIFINDDEDDRTNQQVLIDLEDQIKGFTSFVQILRWSLSIIAAKIVNNREITADYEKAYNIMSDVFHFYKNEQNTKPLNLKQSHLL